MRCVVGVLGCFRLSGIRYKAESTDERFKIVNLLFCLVLLCENVFLFFVVLRRIVGILE